MASSELAASESAAPDGIRWEVAGLFLDALTRRDFAALAACLDPSVRLRALIPRGPIEVQGSADVVAQFRQWFGGPEVIDFEEAALGQLGSRVYLRWRAVRHTDAHNFYAVEQHAFATLGERISGIDLLCSGWAPGARVKPGC